MAPCRDAPCPDADGLRPQREGSWTTDPHSEKPGDRRPPVGAMTLPVSRGSSASTRRRADCRTRAGFMAVVLQLLRTDPPRGGLLLLPAADLDAWAGIRVHAE